MDSIKISNISSITKAGFSKEDTYNLYNTSKTQFQFKNNKAISVLSDNLNQRIIELLKEYPNILKQDRTVQLAFLNSINLLEKLNWDNKKIGINIGSSRGATEILENSHKRFLDNKKLLPQTSPFTTLGNISSIISSHLDLNQISFSHSITCSTGMHSILNAIAWLNSGMSDYFIAGASEASVTDFTIAQMSALKIYSEYKENPCRPFEEEPRKSSFVLGEGSCLLALERDDNSPGYFIESIGFATEKTISASGITKDAEVFQKSMSIAVKDLDIDLIITHSPGTIKGDQAELNAINKIFDKTPFITTNKHLLGHTFASSGPLSIEYALYILETQKIANLPYKNILQQDKPNQIKKILVNSAGFGGNAVSLVISKRD